MRIVAIVNPVSGAGMNLQVATRRVTTIQESLAQHQLAATTHVTERSGHARELAQRAVADHADLVIAWGGDGTVNEVGTSLAGTSTVLGLVPAGSGNGLAGGLGIPKDPRAALSRAIAGDTREVDVGVLNDRPFFNVPVLASTPTSRASSTSVRAVAAAAGPTSSLASAKVSATSARTTGLRSMASRTAAGRFS